MNITKLTPYNIQHKYPYTTYPSKNSKNTFKTAAYFYFSVYSYLEMFFFGYLELVNHSLKIPDARMLTVEETLT